MADQLHRNVVILEVPPLGVRHDFRLGEAPHLIADLFIGLVEARIAEIGGRSALRILDE